MKKFLSTAAAMFGMALLLPSCSEEEGVDIIDGQEETPYIIPFSQDEMAASGELVEFNYGMLGTVTNFPSLPDDNILVSPLSFQILLGMLAEGADETAKKDISTILGCRDLNAVASLNKRMLESINILDPNATAEMANSIWYDESKQLSAAFRNAVKPGYNPEIFACNIIDALDDINGWCSAKTHGLIPEFLDGIDGSLSIYMFNAMYFKGEWAKKFNPDQTVKREFNGSTKSSEIEFMSKTETVDYASNDEYTSIDLHFGNRNFYVTLVLPESGTDINRLAREIHTSLPYQSKKKEKCYIEFPKFNMESSSINLSTFYSKYSNILNLFNGEHLNLLDNVNEEFGIAQKACVQFYETGMTAAAVTGTNQYIASLPVSMRFNRPFLLYLIENQSGLCLLSGKVMNL